MKTDSDDNNQWNVSSVDEFLQYCCPDCDVKEKEKEEFIRHALSQHPLSANYLGTIIIKEELFEDIDEMKHEIPEELDCDAFTNDYSPPDPRSEYFHLFGDNYHGTGLKFDPFSEKF